MAPNKATDKEIIMIVEGCSNNADVKSVTPMIGIPDRMNISEGKLRKDIRSGFIWANANRVPRAFRALAQRSGSVSCFGCMP